MNYKIALVSYVDLLGFSKLIEETRANDAAVQKVFGILKLVKEELSSGGRIHRDADGKKQRIFYSYNFSDLTVRCTEMPEGSDVGEFMNWEMLYLGEKQLSLACDGILLRGGIGIGHVYADSEVVFGPALVKAYHLESEHAVYPRVLLDRDLIWRAEQRDSIKYWKEFVRQGEDGAYYLDYLYGFTINAFLYSHPDRPDPARSLSAHRDAITRALKEELPTKDERLKQKYMWLGLYHNDAVRRIKKTMAEHSSTINFDQFLILDTLLRF